MTAAKNAVVLDEYQQSDEWDLIGLYNRQRLVGGWVVWRSG